MIATLAPLPRTFRAEAAAAAAAATATHYCDDSVLTTAGSDFTVNDRKCQQNTLNSCAVLLRRVPLPRLDAEDFAKVASPFRAAASDPPCNPKH